MPKTPQQRYLERIVKVTPCACGCGEDVKVKRYATMPSYLKRRKHDGYFLPGHNIELDREALLTGCSWPTGPQARNWRGGRHTDKQGYVWLTVDGGQVWEHRVMMEQHLRRALRSDETIHHRNGHRSDNRIENLQLVSNAEHSKLHFSERSRNAAGQFMRRARRIRKAVSCQS